MFEIIDGLRGHAQQHFGQRFHARTLGPGQHREHRLTACRLIPRFRPASQRQHGHLPGVLEGQVFYEFAKRRGKNRACQLCDAQCCSIANISDAHCADKTEGLGADGRFGRKLRQRRLRHRMRASRHEKDNIYFCNACLIHEFT